MAEDKITFEQALERLEALAEEIERGEIGLEESIAKYEEGVKLVQRCRSMLADAELRIQQLEPKPDGTLEVGEEQGAADCGEA